MLKDAVRSYADRHANSDCVALTPVPGLRMMRVAAPNEPLRSMYRPLVCLVLQGAKLLVAGRQERAFDAGQVVIVGVDLPVTGRIIKASPDEPYLAVAIELDMQIVQGLACEVRHSASSSASAPSLFDEQFNEEAVSCAFRLIRLIDDPEAVPVLRPSILRELHYWLLRSRHGPSLGRLAVPDGYQQRIVRAIEVLRSEFRKPIPVARLADASSMSVSAFHRHFKAVTSLSPRQFQNQLRLIEARRLLLMEGSPAGRAASAVGYQSMSHFSRDYSRFFGAPPKRDARTAMQV
jgi:AraC-like DNA-binding protein